MAVVGGGKVVAAAAAAEPGVARRLWRVVRAVLYMLRRGLAPSGRKLAMDLHLLLRRGKIAGKALGHLVTFHHHGHHGQRGGGAFSSAAAAAGSSLSCRVIDPALAVYEPSRGRREVEFSCSNTPSSTAGGGGGGGGGLLGHRRRNRHRRRDEYEYSNASAGGSGYYDHGYDAAYVARVFEMLNDSEHLFNDDDGDALAIAPTTAETTPLWTPARSHSPAPAAASRHRGRITDSPLAANNGDDSASAGGGQQQVDRKADEFIRRFYEQLRAQRSVAATPDYYGASPYSGRRAPRPVAAGIA